LSFDVVFIPTAGLGTRLGVETRTLNKALMSVGSSTVISKIISSYPLTCSFVIALGYQGHLVREYIELAHPEIDVTFIEVIPFQGAGSSLTTTLIQCKSMLGSPFIFNACDSVVVYKKEIPFSDWVGYTPKVASHSYRTLEIEDSRVVKICEKSADPFADSVKNAYAGVAGIRNVDNFWHGLDKSHDSVIDLGEVGGLSALIDSGLTAVEIEWFDTGNLAELLRTQAHFEVDNSVTVLDKHDERIWFQGNRVIKYSSDPNFVAGRVQRSKMLQPFVPVILNSGEHMYAYQHVAGEVLSRHLDAATFSKFLKHCENFWFGEISAPSHVEMRATANKFYFEKSMSRINDFLDQYGDDSDPLWINGNPVPPITELLSQINWYEFQDCVPVKFHGDLHPENVLVLGELDDFMFLDWRQDFGGSRQWGDLYYDLAKIRHGLIVSHRTVELGRYRISMSSKSQSFEIDRDPSLAICDGLLSEWINQNGYDEIRVNLMTALIFLNIAALHPDPYSRLLFALGKLMLSNEMVNP